MKRFVPSLACFAITLSSILVSQQVDGQTTLRDSIERLDTNKDGRIDPNEITPLARPYLEQIAPMRRLPLDRPNDINRLLDAARIYYAVRNGISGGDIRPDAVDSLLPFGPKYDEPLVPGFGLAKVKFPYTQADLDFADRTLSSHDRNQDGFIDRAEAANNRWTHRKPFLDDFDKDGRLSRIEMAQRYARRRLLEESQEQMRQQARRTGNGVRSGAPRYEDDRQRKDRERREREQRERESRRRSGSYYLAATMMGRFDSNRNGRLESQELRRLGIPLTRVDIDQDGELTREELQAHVERSLETADALAERVPDWFAELDANRDRQVALTEFTTEFTTAKLNEFRQIDTNGDGLLTTVEVLQSTAFGGSNYLNEEAQVLAPRKTIISEIDIEDDFVIADLNLRLSVTHTHVSQLDAYLTGPDGQRIELFTDIGGSGDHFDQTLFDDQSEIPITKVRAPYRGTFLPEGLLNRQPGLSHFNGKSTKGVWQLVIRCSRSDRFGMLHSWSLILKQADGVRGRRTLEAPGD